MFRRQVFNRYLSRFRGMSSRRVTGVSNFSPSFPLLFLLFLSRRDAARYLARHCTGEKEGSRGNVSSIYAFSLSLSFVGSFESRADYSIGTGFLDRDSSILSRGILFTVPRSLAHSRLRFSRALSLSVPRRVSR